MPPKTRFTWAHQYDDARDAEDREATKIIITEPSLTQQQFTEDADLNVMMKRMNVGDGAIPPAVLDPSYYGDFSEAMDFRQVMDVVHDAEEKFKALPADLRARFNNDPARLMAFVQDPKNDEESVKLGLLKRLTPDAPEEVKRKRDLAAWRKANEKEAAELFPEPQGATPPAPPKVNT